MRRLTQADWMRRANDAALGGGADITPEPAQDDWLDEWWYTVEEDADPLDDKPFEKENDV